ncbi:MAG: hypothetical protein ABSB74_02650 [Tepidisphaeraceae bacterium]
MTATQLESLKSDFLEWSGGFEPECQDDIETYIASSMSADLDEGEAREALTHWMRDAQSAGAR